MRSLKIIYPDETRVWIGECPADYWPVFEQALNELFALQQEHGDPMLAFNDKAVIGLVRFIASFLPVLPFRREYFNVEPFLTPLDIPMLTAHFYGVGGHIGALHAPDEEESEEQLTEDEYTAENMPIKGSGNLTADLLARLSQTDNSNANAMALIRTYDMRTLNAFVQQVGELRRDPKERFLEYQGKRFQGIIDDAKINNPMLYAEIYGLTNQDEQASVNIDQLNID
jgi:hypothetical protein